MQSSQSAHKGFPTIVRRNRRALSLVEVLICVSIASMLLTSVAVAFRASFNSYKDSQQRGQMLNSARGFMVRITSDIRMSDSAAPYDLSSTISASENAQFNSQVVPGTPTAGLSSAGGTGVLGIQLLKTHADTWDPLASVANPVLITYWFDSANSQIMMTRKYGAIAPTPVVVCRFVQTFQVYMLPVFIPANPLTKTPSAVILRRASVSITTANKDANGARIISDGGQDLTLALTDAAVPRKTFPGL